MKSPVVVAWSGGKDSSIMVQRIRADTEYEIVALLTTVTQDYDRVSMHGVRRDILHAQAEALGHPLIEAPIRAGAANDEYESSFLNSLALIRARWPDANTVAFGDLFLADVRRCREDLLEGRGWTPLFPLWGEDTELLARRFVDDGFLATLCCVDTEQLGPEWAGRAFDADLLSGLPAGVDPCGERGEFHTCVHGGPIFTAPLPIVVGERVRRDARFEYCDLTLGGPARA